MVGLLFILMDFGSHYVTNPHKHIQIDLKKNIFTSQQNSLNMNLLGNLPHFAGSGHTVQQRLQDSPGQRKSNKGAAWLSSQLARCSAKATLVFFPFSCSYRWINHRSSQSRTQALLAGVRRIRRTCVVGAGKLTFLMSTIISGTFPIAQMSQRNMPKQNKVPAKSSRFPHRLLSA